MLTIIYLNGMENGLVKETKDIKESCEFIANIGEERINKIVITDLQPTKTVTKEDLKAYYDL